MPGTIEVSVLEFMALQSSSPLSQMSIKISMGKREYQTWEKGDFSFPLTTLRDNLIVTLQDTEGKEISHTVVETRLVIEKGIWDNVFPLEGGGHVHMKLQFVLSEEDRQRIRIMRESALRKKHDELLNSELKSPAQATTVSSNVAQSLQPNNEVSDLHKNILQNEVIQAGLRSTIPSSFFKKGKSGPEDKEGTHSVRKQTHPNDIDRYEGTSSITPKPHVEEVSHTKSVEKSPINASTIFLEEASRLGSLGSVVASKNQAPAKLRAEGANDPEKQGPLEKTPSKIRNMISAFESSLNQDMRPKIRPAPIKSESTKTRVELASKSTHLNEVKAENTELAQISGRARNPIHPEDVQQAAAHIGKREEQIGVVRAGYTQAKVVHKVDVRKEKSSSEDFARASSGERASVSGKMLNDKGKHPLSNLFARRRYSSGNLFEQKNGKGIQPKTLQEVNFQGASGDEPHFSECYGAWIFPDGGKHLCITTGRKQIMDLMGGCHAEGKRPLQKTSSRVTENAKEAKEGNKTAQRCRESNIENSRDDDGTSRRPIGQVMRVAIMVGFATLVFFTRQRKSG